MLEQLLGSKLRAKLLSWLMMHAQERYFVRQLTALLGEDSTNVSRELSKLAGLGVLEFQQEGRQKYYRVNRSFPAFAELRGLVLKTAGLGEALQAALAPLAAGIRAAFVFGSFAHGAETAGSDVDLLIVGGVTPREVSAALGPVGRQLGREINPVIYTPAEFRSKAAAGHHFVTALLQGKHTYLIGNDHELEILAGRGARAAAQDVTQGGRRPPSRRGS